MAAFSKTTKWSDVGNNEIVACYCSNEKTGIPVEILQVLDVCVEIPQRGVIRSLNVHVSGALFIWEYFKQWSLDSSASGDT